MVFRGWYITGALMGGAPLAQGSVYIHLKRRTADRLAVALVATLVIASACVIASPIRHDLVEPYRLTGKVLEWKWVRSFSPFLNTYAFVFLVGGALISARRYAKALETRNRFTGNVLIAVGALLPGIGGTFTRFGYTEVLYVTELLGLALIMLGYRFTISTVARPPAHRPARRTIGIARRRGAVRPRRPAAAIAARAAPAAPPGFLPPPSVLSAAR